MNIYKMNNDLRTRARSVLVSLILSSSFTSLLFHSHLSLILLFPFIYRNIPFT